MAEASLAVTAIVGLMFAILLIEPINSATNDLVLTGSAGTVVDLIPLFVAILILGGLGLTIREVLEY